MAIKIPCKPIAEKIKKEAREMAAKFEAQEWRKPKLVTIIANDDPASERYVRNKMKACEDCGIEHEEITFFMPDHVDIETYLDYGMEYLDYEGLMLQLPVYWWLDSNELIQYIYPAKDVDCLTAHNMGKLALGDNSFMPATVAGIMRLFKEEGYDLKGKTVVIRGRSNIVGKPLALAMINAGATVISENSHTADGLEGVLSQYRPVNIIIDATGRKGMTHVCDYYIDVTTIVGEDGKLHGSLSRPDFLKSYTKYTPVPGGVGLLTCAQLAWNTAYLACKQAEIEVDDVINQ